MGLTDRQKQMVHVHQKIIEKAAKKINSNGIPSGQIYLMCCTTEFIFKTMPNDEDVENLVNYLVDAITFTRLEFVSTESTLEYLRANPFQLRCEIQS